MTSIVASTQKSTSSRRPLWSLVLYILIALSPAVVCAETEQQPSADIVDDNSFLITNARVLVPTGMLPSAAIKVEKGIITGVGKNLAIDSDLPVMDIGGKTVTPGLIDAHTHTYFEGQLFDSLRFGVTTQLDMSTSVDFAEEHREERQYIEETDYADFFSAGTIVTSTGGHGTQFGAGTPTIDAPADARSHIRDRVAEGSDWIKIAYEPGNPFLTSLDKATLAALIEATHELGLLAVVHVSKLSAARDAVEVGADGLVHVFADRIIDDDLLNMMQTKQVFVIPTLTVIAAAKGTKNEKHWVTEGQGLLQLSRSQKSSLISGFRARPELARFFKLDIAYENIRKMKAANIPIIVGTDAPNPGTAHGVSIHDELSHLVNAGLSAFEAMQAATVVPSQVFDLEGRGRIEVGMRADFVIFDGKPDQMISDSRKISRVLKNGFELK